MHRRVHSLPPRRERRRREHDDLVGRRHVHVQSLLGNGRQPRAARRVTNLSIELYTLGFESLTPAVEVAHCARLIDAVRPACNDACRHEDETKERERNARAA
jgi:hypothetical protein